MADPEKHIPLERMKEVATQPDALFTPDEQDHLYHCKECLDLFERLVLDSP